MVLIGALVAGVAASPLRASTNADVIKARQAALHDLGADFKDVNDELKADKPKMAVMQKFAKQVRMVAKEQYGWFPAGSGPESGLKTAAKPDIWDHPDQFKAAQDGLATQAMAFNDAVSGGDIDKVRDQVKDMGKACGTCHRTFRVRDEQQPH